MSGELESARITSFSSKYQVILLDDNKWGGKIIEEFSQYQNCRIISIVLNLNNNEFVGLISVYAITRSGANENTSSNSSDRKGKKQKIRFKTTAIIKDIVNKWKSKFKSICSIILGDIQETISTEDRYNYGKYRLK